MDELKKVYSICEVCKKEWQRYKTQGRGKFCSQRCYGISLQEKAKSLVYNLCEKCGKEFKTYPKNQRSFCGVRCYTPDRRDVDAQNISQ